MDTGDRGQLLAANLTVDEIRDYLGVDSLSYLDLDRLVEATGATGAGFCHACLTGDYPIAIPDRLSKQVLEADSGASSEATPVIAPRLIEVAEQAPPVEATRQAR
jgi:amidophosphoribosyltransferase